MKQGLCIFSSCDLSGCFLRTKSLDLFEFWHCARNPYSVVHDSPIFLKTFAQKIREMGQKQDFLNLKKNFVITFHRTCSVNFQYLLCSSTNPIFGKNLVPEIQAKMHSANQIVGFLNRQNKLIFYMLIQIHKNRKQKSFGWAWSKMVWPFWSQDSKIDCISKMSRWNKLIFSMLVQIQES